MDGRMNVKDVSSPYCQRVKCVVMERLDRYDADDESWQEILIPDKTCTPAELAASRIDVQAWFKRSTAVIAALPSSWPQGKRRQRRRPNSRSPPAGYPSCAASWPDRGSASSAMPLVLPLQPRRYFIRGGLAAFCSPALFRPGLGPPTISVSARATPAWAEACAPCIATRWRSCCPPCRVRRGRMRGEGQDGRGVGLVEGRGLRDSSHEAPPQFHAHHNQRRPE